MSSAPRDETPNGWLIDPPAGLVIFLSNQIVSLTLFERGVSALKLVPSLAVAALKTLRLEAPHVEPEFRQLYENAMGGMSLAEHFQPTAVTAWRSQAFVAFWAAVETTLEQVLMNHLMRVPDAEQRVIGVTPRMSKRIGELNDHSRIGVFVRQWERELREADVIARAEIMLSAFGITLSFDEKTRQVLTELAEARNVIVHRGGIVDASFKNKVPWTRYSVGNTYEISDAGVLDAYTAAHTVATCLLKQVDASPWFYRAQSIGNAT